MTISPFSMSLLMSSAGVFTLRKDKVRQAKIARKTFVYLFVCLFVLSYWRKPQWPKAYRPQRRLWWWFLNKHYFFLFLFMFLSCSTWGRPQLREAWRPRWRGWWSCCLAARGGVHRPSLWRTGKFSFWNMIWVNIEKKQRSWYSQQKVNIEIMTFPTSKDTFSCRPSLGPPSRVPQPQSDIAFELELFLKMFRSQECLFGYDGLVIWYYSPRDELPRCPQSCEGWWELNDESSKESKSWENEELDDLNTTLTLSELRLWPPITSQLQAFSIRPGQVFEAERKGKGRSRIDPGSEHQVLLANPYHCTAGYFHLLPYLLQGIALLFPGWFLQSKCQWIFYPV